MLTKRNVPAILAIQGFRDVFKDAKVEYIEYITKLYLEIIPYKGGCFT